MYVCMYGCTCVCMHVCVCMYVYTCICTCVRMYVCMYVRAYGRRLGYSATVFQLQLLVLHFAEDVKVKRQEGM